MKKSNEKKLQKLTKQLFSQNVEEFTRLVTTWHKQKPRKRTAFLLFCDEDAGRWSVRMLGNPRSKYYTETSLNGLHNAMEKSPELFNAVRAHFKCAERELKKAAKAQQKEETDHGKDNVQRRR